MCGIARFDGYFLPLNPAGEESLGFPTETLQSKAVIEFIHSNDRPGTLTETEQLRQDHSSIAFENRFLCRYLSMA